MGSYSEQELTEMLHEKKCRGNGNENGVCNWDLYRSQERRHYRKEAIRLLNRWGNLTKQEIDVLVEHTI